MGKIGTTEVGTNALRQLLSREYPVAFHDLAFAMDPLRYNRVEPGTLPGICCRQAKPTPPDFVGKSNDPTRLLACPGNQSVSGGFLAGSADRDC